MKKETKEKINKILTVLIISLSLSCLVQIINYYVMGNHLMFSFHKIVLYASIFSFLLLHIMFDIEDLYNYIFKNRYKLAACLLLFTSLMQFTNSSNSYYSLATFEKDKYNSIYGKPISYLSDEYSVETPIAISQSYNGYKYYNSFLRGIPTDVFSIVHPPVLHFLSIGKLYNIGFILGPHIGLAFDNNFNTLFLALATFELLELITNKKKFYSFVGAFVVTASFASQTQISISLMIACGETIIVLLDKFLNEKSTKKKVLYTLGILLSGITYVFKFYPAYIVSFAYIFLPLAIWVFLKNKDNYKPCIIDLILLIVSIILIAIVGLTYYYTSYETLKIVSQTVYPGNRISNNHNGFGLLFTYLYNFLIPFILFKDNFVVASIFSLFPIPIILGIFYIFKKPKKEDLFFLIPMIIFTLFITVFVLCGFPKIISKITLMSYTIQERAAVALALGCFYIMMYIFSNIQINFFGKYSKIVIIFFLMILIALFAMPKEISQNRILLSIVPSIFCLLTYCLMNNDKKEYRLLFVFALIAISLPGLFFRPITVGVHAITDLDISARIRTITESDQDALWIGADLPRGLSNLLVANGAKTLTSVAPYPNKDMYLSLLGEEALKEEKNFAWNRYGQFETELLNINDVQKSEKSEDIINLYINYDGLRKLNVKYLLTYDDEETLREKGISATKIYEKTNDYNTKVEDKLPTGIYIYEIVK